jgi:hypothetical protein
MRYEPRDLGCRENCRWTHIVPEVLEGSAVVVVLRAVAVVWPVSGDEGRNMPRGIVQR